MGAVVLKVGKHRIACGLDWVALGTVSERGAEIRRLAKRHSPFGVLLTSRQGSDSARRAYLGLLPKGASSAARSAIAGAAWLAAAVKQPTLYVWPFRADKQSGVWLVMVRPGSEVSEDRVVSHDQAGELIDSLIDDYRLSGAPDALQVRYASIDGIESRCLDTVDSGQCAFEELVRGIKGELTAPIRQLSGMKRSTLLLLIALLVAIAGAIAAYLVVQKLREEQELQRQLDAAALENQERARIQTMRDLRIREATEAALAEDTAGPSAMDVVAPCLEILNRMGHIVGGWSIRQLDCDARGAVSVTFAPIAGWQGTNEILVQALAELSAAPVTISPKNDSAVWRLSSGKRPRRDAMQLSRLPPLLIVMRSTGSALQALQQANPSTTSTFGDSSPRVIRYQDPSKRGDGVDALSEVPPEFGYRTAKVTVRGRIKEGLGASAIAIDAPWVAVNKVTVRPSRDGRTADWQLEASYVAAN